MNICVELYSLEQIVSFFEMVGTKIMKCSTYQRIKILSAGPPLAVSHLVLDPERLIQNLELAHEDFLVDQPLVGLEVEGQPQIG